MRAFYSHSIFVSLLISVLFVCTFFFAVAPTQTQARTTIWQEPSMQQGGIPLFWRFFNGYISYYNLRYTKPPEVDVTDADLIIAYTWPSDPKVAQIDTQGLPIAYFGQYFWFAPSLSRAWQFALFFAHPNNLHKNIRFYGAYSSYFSLGLFDVPKNIVILHRAPRCHLLPWWKRWWYPCAPVKPFKYYFEMYDWPGRSGTVARDLQIRYSANIYDADTDEVLHNGAAVSVGTRLRFNFGEHKNEHIKWTGTKHWRYLLSYLRLRHGWGYWGWWIWREHTFWNLYPKHNTGMWVEEGELPHAACRDEDLIFAGRVWRFNRYILGNILNYVTIATEKPIHSIAGIENLECEIDSGDTVCTVGETGNLDFDFIFEDSTLRAYHSYNRIKYNWGPWEGFDTCLGVNDLMYKRAAPYGVTTNCNNGDRCWEDSGRYYKKYRFAYVGGDQDHNTTHFFEPFELSVPEQTITYSISVVDPNSSPSAPIITGEENVLVDTQAQFSLTSSDPEEDTLRYGIDWDGDAEVDQWLPESGYTPSGTLLNTSHTWAEDGEVTFQVLAEDANTARSTWTEFTVDVLGEPILSFDAEDYLIPKNSSTLLEWSSKHASTCDASGSWAGSKSLAGSERTETLTEFQNEYTLACENALASTTQTISIYTYVCGDNVCTTNVETCSTCSADCGECGSEQASDWDVFLDLTEDPPQVRYGGGDDEVGN